MNVAVVNFYSHIRAFKSENFISVVILAVHDDLSSDEFTSVKRGREC